MRLLKLIERTVNTRITPLAYLFAVWQGLFGFNQWLADEMGGAATVLAQTDALIPVEWWGLILLSASVALIVGMLSKYAPTVQLASFVGFSMWIMASISYALSGFVWLHAPGAIIQALMWGYFFLATGLDQLWDYAPNRDS